MPIRATYRIPEIKHCIIVHSDNGSSSKNLSLKLEKVRKILQKEIAVNDDECDSWKMISISENDFEKVLKKCSHEYAFLSSELNLLTIGMPNPNISENDTDNKYLQYIPDSDIIEIYIS